MATITIKWGTEGNEEKTYTFNNEYDLKMFMKGVDEANGWLNYYIVEKKQEEKKDTNYVASWAIENMKVKI